MSSLLSSSGGICVKSLQCNALTRMLSLSTSASSASASSFSSSVVDLSQLGGVGWKVLIYDTVGQEILSPLLTVSELRKLGITLHMSLKSKREKIPDVPAVYFIAPTLENLERVAKDTREGLYESVYINFTSTIPRVVLEQFAQAVLTGEAIQQVATNSSNSNNSVSAAAAAVGAAAVARIQKILDQYVEFISLEEQLFTFSNSTIHKDSYLKLNSTADEQELFNYIDQVVDSLFAVCVTLATVPIIRCKAGNAAEMIATKLDQKLREHLASKNNLFQNTSNNAASTGTTSGGSNNPGSSSSALSLHRPLLIIYDRTVDLRAPLLHAWSYQALLTDLLKMQNNRVTITLMENGKKTPPKTYDLLSSEDKFWKNNSLQTFPVVAEALEERIKAYQTEVGKITSGANPNGTNGPVSINSTGTEELSSAINSLPKLQKKKRLLDTHTNIATALVKEIKSREIDEYYDLEQHIVFKPYGIEKNQLNKHLGLGGINDKNLTNGVDATNIAPTKGSFLDRLRLLLIYYLSSDAVTPELVQQWKSILLNSLNNPSAEADPSNPNPTSTSSASTPLLPHLSNSTPTYLAESIEYVNSFKFLTRLGGGGGMSAAADMSLGGGGGDASSQNVFGNLGKLAEQAFGGIAGGMKQLVANSSNHLTVTKLTDLLMSNKESAETEQFLYFDPKAVRGARRAGANATPFRDCMVFMLGGGTYNEYVNLQEYVIEKNKAAHASGNAHNSINSVVYGCTELVSPDHFAYQLAMLGHAANASRVD